MKQNDLKLILAEVDNFKGIRHQLVRFDGHSAFIFGGNGIGKSSFIDAIRSAFDTDFRPTEPITTGEESGSVRIQVGSDNTVYDIYIKYTEKNKAGYITLHENGQEVSSPRTKIFSIIGDFSFDIFDWMRAAFNTKVSMLKKVSGCEDKINANEHLRKEALAEKSRLEKNYTEMSNVNSKKYRPFTDAEIQTYHTLIPEDAITKELEGLQPALQEWNRYNNGVKESAQKIEGWKKEMQGKVDRQVEIGKEVTALEAQIADIHRQIEVKKQQVATLKDETISLNNSSSIESTRMEKGVDWLKANAEPNTAEITNRLSEAKLHNDKVRLIAEYRERHKEMMDVKDNAEEQEAVIKKLDAEKVKIMSGYLAGFGLALTFDTFVFYLIVIVSYYSLSFV